MKQNREPRDKPVYIYIERERERKRESQLIFDKGSK